MMIVLMIVTEKASFRHLHRCNVRSAILIDHNSGQDLVRFIHYRLSINNGSYHAHQKIQNKIITCIYANIPKYGRELKY